jgi:hypothetical protein
MNSMVWETAVAMRETVANFQIRVK